MPIMTLHATCLTYERDDHLLFSDVNFTLLPGNILQITGANGSGKTTLLRILCGLTLPTSGTILWEDKPITEFREFYFSHFLYVGHQSGIRLSLTPYENLIHASLLKGQYEKQSILAALQQIGLSEQANLICDTLSAGQQRRVALAKLLLLKVPLWILDEPFNALDQAGIDWLETQLTSHCEAGGMVILTSHQTINFQTISPQQLCLNSN